MVSTNAKQTREVVSCGSSCTTSAECKTIRIAVSSVMDNVWWFHTRGSFLKKVVVIGSEWSEKWTGCSRVVWEVNRVFTSCFKELIYLCVTRLTCALQFTYCNSSKCCFLQINHKAFLVKPYLNTICIHFSMTCWVHSKYSWLYALWLISRRRGPRVLRALWRGVRGRLCDLGDVLHSIACGLVEWFPRAVLFPL